MQLRSSQKEKRPIRGIDVVERFAPGEAICEGKILARTIYTIFD